MSFQKNKRIKLSKPKMKLLNNEVLERDNWTCQNPECGYTHQLDIPHHIIFKSQGGNDSVENLITLCLHCHRTLIHNGKLFISKIDGEITFSKERNFK